MAQVRDAGGYDAQRGARSFLDPETVESVLKELPGGGWGPKDVREYLSAGGARSHVDAETILTIDAWATESWYFVDSEPFTREELLRTYPAFSLLGVPPERYFAPQAVYEYSLGPGGAAEHVVCAEDAPESDRIPAIAQLRRGLLGDLRPARVAHTRVHFPRAGFADFLTTAGVFRTVRAHAGAIAGTPAPAAIEGPVAPADGVPGGPQIEEPEDGCSHDGCSRVRDGREGHDGCCHDRGGRSHGRDGHDGHDGHDGCSHGRDGHESHDRDGHDGHDGCGRDGHDGCGRNGRDCRDRAPGLEQEQLRELVRELESIADMVARQNVRVLAVRARLAEMAAPPQ